MPARGRGAFCTTTGQERKIAWNHLIWLLWIIALIFERFGCRHLSHAYLQCRWGLVYLGQGTGSQSSGVANVGQPILSAEDSDWLASIEWIASIDCIAADGRIAMPRVLCQIDTSDWDPLDDYKLTGFGATVIETSTDWLTEEDAFGWLYNFHETTKYRKDPKVLNINRHTAEGQPRLLLFSGQPAFLTLDFLRFCEKYNIIPFSFPPDIGHLM